MREIKSQKNDIIFDCQIKWIRNIKQGLFTDYVLLHDNQGNGFKGIFQIIFASSVTFL